MAEYKSSEPHLNFVMSFLHEIFLDSTLQWSLLPPVVTEFVINHGLPSTIILLFIEVGLIYPTKYYT